MAIQLPEENLIAAGKNEVYELPPLILHPFAEPAGASEMIESSRASLALQGFLPPGESSADELNRRVLAGRYAEFRMLFYVGRDVRRWIGQCVEHMLRVHGRLPEGVAAQSFAVLLVRSTPRAVSEKLRSWGVTDYVSIFSRALGLNAMFAALPARELLADEFLTSYFRYADRLFQAYLNEAEYVEISPAEYRFDLYSSGEYARRLERAWE